MNLNEYPSNSKKNRQEQKLGATEDRKIEKVVSGSVRTKKKGDTNKLVDALISSSVGDVKSSLVGDVLIPIVRGAIADILNNAVDVLFRDGTGRGRSSSGRAGYVPYASYSRHDDRRPVARDSDRFDLDEILFETNRDAIAVREQLYEEMDRYGLVTVAGLYDMAGLRHPYTSNKYGWMGFRNPIDIAHTREGWVLRLPKPSPID